MKTTKSPQTNQPQSKDSTERGVGDEYRLVVPFFVDETAKKVDRVAMVKTTIMDRYPPTIPAFIANTIKGVRKIHRTSDYKIVEMGTDGGVRTTRGMRGHIQEACRVAIVKHIDGILEEATQLGKLPPISDMNRDAIALRCAEQLASWAAYNTTPRDMVEYRQRCSVNDEKLDHAKLQETIAKFQKTERYARQREKDAQELLEVQSGVREGPIPANNLAYVESTMEVSGTPTSLDLGDTKSPYEIQMQAVVALLIETITDPESGSGPKISDSTMGRIRVVTQIMEQARGLSMHTGILVSVKIVGESASSHALVVNVDEAKLLALGKTPTAAAKARVGEIVGVWERARWDEIRNPSGLRRRTINREGRGDGVIQRDLTPLDIGYECPNRAGYYRSSADGAYEWVSEDPNYEKYKREGGCLPARAYVPLGKALQYIYLNENGVRFAMASCFRTIPDILMPTSPMVNLLLEGSTPYHMGSHAMLDQYTMLLWAAVERTCPMSMRPIADVPKDSDQELEVTPFRRDGAEEDSSHDAVVRRSEWGMEMLSIARTHDHAASPLPAWCGKWFVPHAYMPRVTAVHELDRFYSKANGQYRRLVGEEWLKCAACSSSLGIATIIDRVGEELKRCQSDQGVEEDEMIDAVPKEVVKEKEWLLKRDGSAAGHAEYVMTLALMATYFDLMEDWDAQFHRRVRLLREKHLGKTNSLSLGNRSKSVVKVRSRAYYDEFWKLCIESTGSLLEIHEVTILMLNSRWVDPDKAVCRMTQQQERVHAKMVENANENAVDIVLNRRRKNWQRRMGLTSLIGDIVTQVEHPSFPERWIHDRVSGCANRPDLPTYKELLLFEAFHDALPTLNAARRTELTTKSDAATAMKVDAMGDNDGADDDGDDDDDDDDDDGLINQLVKKTKELSIAIGREQEADPGCVMEYYELPLHRARSDPAKTQRGAKHEMSTSAAGEPVHSGETETRKAPKRTRN